MIPGLKEIFDANPVKATFPNATLGEFLSRFFVVILFLASALMFYWIVWGVFHYLFSGGDKENLGKARKRITWAIIGFVIIVISFAISQYVQTIFVPKLPGGVTNVVLPK